jgi:SPP1 family predicted phage head-tail adaptor
VAGLTLGDLRHRITIEQKTRGPSDGAGGNVSETWSTFKKVWAKVEPRQGREIIAADQAVHRRTALITMRRRTDVNTSMRVNYKGRIFAILGMRDIEDGGWRWSELQCEENAPS